MGVELEWESGSTAHDDLPPFPNHSRRKWPWVAAFAIVLIVAMVYAAIRIRLQQIDEWQQRTLRDVVIAEVTALRIGDENAFLEFQHSGDEVWLAQQRDYFVAVQGAADLQLSGNILESEITSDGLLGVVRLMEIENAVPYERLWFYWNFADLGWRHLPQNPDLWGDAATNSSDHLRIDYYARDKALAKQLADTLPRWLQIGCEAMACATLPSWHVEILPDPNLNLSWEALAPWNLRIPSPYLTRCAQRHAFLARVAFFYRQPAQRPPTQLFHTRDCRYPRRGSPLPQASDQRLAMGRVAGAKRCESAIA